MGNENENYESRIKNLVLKESSKCLEYIKNEKLYYKVLIGIGALAVGYSFYPNHGELINQLPKESIKSFMDNLFLFGSNFILFGSLGHHILNGAEKRLKHKLGIEKLLIDEGENETLDG